MTVKDHVCNMLIELRRLRDEPLSPVPIGLEFEREEQIIGITFPSDLRDWLLICNGSTIGPGGVFGVGRCPKSLRIAERFLSEFGWGQHGWIPIADDGCGDTYVIDASITVTRGNPVYFID